MNAPITPNATPITPIGTPPGGGRWTWDAAAGAWTPLDDQPAAQAEPATQPDPAQE